MSEIEWLEPWQAVHDELHHVLQRRLALELEPDHPLRTMQPLVIGRNDDSVIVELSQSQEARYAILELSWRDEAWIGPDSVTYYASAEEASRAMKRDARELGF